MLKVNDQVAIKGQRFTVKQILETGPNTRRELKIVDQYIVEGRRGATRLLQEFENTYRTIDLAGRVVTETKANSDKFFDL